MAACTADEPATDAAVRWAVDVLAREIVWTAYWPLDREDVDVSEEDWDELNARLDHLTAQNRPDDDDLRAAQKILEDRARHATPVGSGSVAPEARIDASIRSDTYGGISGFVRFSEEQLVGGGPAAEDLYDVVGTGVTNLLRDAALLYGSSLGVPDATSRDVERASDVVDTALALASSVLESGLGDGRLRELYPEVGESDWEDIVSVADLIARNLHPGEEVAARARRRLEDAAASGHPGTSQAGGS